LGDGRRFSRHREVRGVERLADSQGRRSRVEGPKIAKRVIMREKSDFPITPVDLL